MRVFPDLAAHADPVAVVGCSWSRESEDQHKMNWKALLTTMAVSALTIAIVFRFGVGRAQIVGA